MLVYGKVYILEAERYHWFFLGRDFAIQTFSLKTVLRCVFFVFESRQIQNRNGPCAMS